MVAGASAARTGARNPKFSSDGEQSCAGEGSHEPDESEATHPDRLEPVESRESPQDQQVAEGEEGVGCDQPRLVIKDRKGGLPAWV